MPRDRRPARLILAGPALALAIVLTWTMPASDLANSNERVGAAPAAVREKSARERYEAVRARGAPVAVIRHRTALRAGPGADSERLALIRRATDFDSARVLAVSGRRGKWLRVIATELPNGGRGWVRIGAVRLVANPWRITADLSDREVTVARGGRVVRRFQVAVGGPSTPTPVGRFAVTDKIRFTDGSQAYGCCALALSGHQPNIAQGWSGGDRLAIHGTLLSGTIGYAASLGCLRARDEDARWLLDRVLLGTVVEFKP
jgi:lipoprotein-anchoring transpeptidase ErfK/SrfK